MDKIKSEGLPNLRQTTWTGRRYQKSTVRFLRREKKFARRALRRKAKVAERNRADGPISVYRGWLF